VTKFTVTYSTEPGKRGPYPYNETYGPDQISSISLVLEGYPDANWLPLRANGFPVTIVGETRLKAKAGQVLTILLRFSKIDVERLTVHRITPWCHPIRFTPGVEDARRAAIGAAAASAARESLAAAENAALGRSAAP
jgi:hypothetical protein